MSAAGLTDEEIADTIAALGGDPAPVIELASRRGAAVLADREMAERFLVAVVGDEHPDAERAALRYAVAVPPGPDGRRSHGGWIESYADDWPADRAAFTDTALSTAGTRDVYVCPAVASGPERRRKGSALRPMVAWVDVDQDVDDERAALLATLVGAGAVVVLSGSPGARHVYVPLSRPVELAEHHALNTALCDGLGGDRSKRGDDSLLRLPGTLNHKRTPPTPVALVEPGTGERVDPDDLAAMLGHADLAAAVAAAGARPASGEGSAPPAEVSAFLEAHTGAERPELLESGPLRWFRDKVAAGESRHGTLLGVAATAAREVRAGAYPAEQARDALAEAFATVKPEADGDEFERGWSWAVAQAAAMTVEQCRAELPAVRGPIAALPGGAEVTASADALPAAVWEASPVLSHIRRAALARVVSPDAVLHAVLAVLAAALHHRSRVDTGVRESTLAHFVALIGPSGAGKTEALAVARDLLAPTLAARKAFLGRGKFADTTLGSGEGVIDAFMGEQHQPVHDADGQVVTKPDGTPKTEKIITQVRHNALLVTDEGRQALAIAARSGSTLLGVLCELWSGSQVGQRNSIAGGRTRQLGAGSYALGLLLGFQPDTITDLFADVAGGAPQRFAFVSVSHSEHDPEIRTPWPGELGALTISPSPITVELPEVARDAVYRHRVERARPGYVGAPLDGHRMLLRCRTAALLALLHDTMSVSVPVWDLAGLLVDHSCALRDRLADIGTERARAEAARREESAVRVAVESAAGIEARNRVARAADQIVNAVGRADGATLTRGKAFNRIRSDLRDVREMALEFALAGGRLIGEEGGKVLRLPGEDGEK